MTTTPYPVRLEPDIDAFLFGRTNMRPRSSITPQRVVALAEEIRLAQMRGAGYWMTGIERPVIVYENGAEDTGLHIEDGQERILAVRHLIETGAGYNFIGIPVELRPQPLSLWESTRLQMALHDVDPVNLIDQTRRAVELKELPSPDGRKSTWQDVVSVMGKSETTWSHYQNLLALIPELQDAIIDGRMGGQVGGYIGKDLPAELQRKYLDDLLDVCRSLYKTKALIQRILDREEIEDVIEDADGEDLVDIPDDEDDLDDEEPEQDPAKVDKEATWLINQGYKIITRLEVLAAEGRLAGVGKDLAQIGERFTDLEAYA